MKKTHTTYIRKAISVTKVNDVLITWLHHNLNSSCPRIVDIYRSLLIHECCLASEDFSRFIRSFESLKKKNNYEKACNTLIKEREKFIHQLIYILDRNKQDAYNFCYISLAWSEVIEYFLEHALQNFDIHAVHIAFQLQDDLNQIVEELSIKKKHVANMC